MMLRLKIRPLEASVPGVNPISSLGSGMSLSRFLNLFSYLYKFESFVGFEGDNAH